MFFPFTIAGNWNFIDIIWNVMKHSPTDSGMMEKTAMICWEIWKNRNDMRHGGAVKQGHQILRKALRNVEEYRAAHEEVLPQRDKDEICWSAPREGRYKANVDGATFTNPRASGMGLVIRNNQGLVMAAMSRKITAPLSALSVEAKAMELAVEWTLEMGFREVTFETDSLCLHNALKGVATSASLVETITDSILRQAQNYRFFDVSHVKRQTRPYLSPICKKNWELSCMAGGNSQSY
nr:hypothetical protein CFP56_41711 [Quercus suber]